MATGHWGSQEYVEGVNMKRASILTPVETFITNSTQPILQEIDAEKLALKNKIEDLEYQLANQEAKIVEVIKEVPVEVVREIRTIEEKIVEKEVQVIKEFPVYKEKIIKEFVDRPIEVVKEVEKEIVKEIKLVPLWAYGALLAQTLTIIILLLK